MGRPNAYEFGPYCLNAGARTVTRSGTPIRITPKAFDILLYLVSNPGRTVSREELMREIWRNTYVEAGTLTYNISQLRKILGEYSPGVPYIQTLPKNGYRFIEEIKKPNGMAPSPMAASCPPAAPPESRRWRRFLLILVLPATTLAAALLVWFRPSHVGKNPDTAGLVRLTSDAGLTTTPALSPDGKLVAYASDRGGSGNLNLWVQQVGGGPAIRLTQRQADDYSPCFSPDGQRIAFRSERDGGGIYVVPALGGESRKITSFGRRPRFSPDGKWIAFATGDQSSTSAVFQPPGAEKMYVVDADGGPPHEVRPEFPSTGYPVWTPDGKHLLFLGNRDPHGTQNDNGMDWWVTAIEAGIGAGPVVRTGASAAFRELGLPASQAPEDWTKDGAGIVFSGTLKETWNVWRIPISSSTWRVSGPPHPLTHSTTMDLHPSIVGSHMVFSSLTGALDVWSIPLDADHAKPGAALQRLTHDAFAHYSPVVSMDGTKLAFCSRRSGSRDVWLKDLRTGYESAVSIRPGPALAPRFLADGNTLVYKIVRKTSSGYAYSLADGNTRHFCDDCIDYGWSFDRKKVLLVGSSPARVSVLDLASNQRTALLDHPSYVLWNAFYSPDDRWVAFNATTASTSRIFIAPARDSGRVPESEWVAVTDGAWDDKPRWSPNGDFLYYLSERDGFRCIWAQHLNTGKDGRKHPDGAPVAIFHAHEAALSMRGIGWGDVSISLARDKMVFNLSERKGNIWMADLVEVGR